MLAVGLSIENTRARNKVLPEKLIREKGENKFYRTLNPHWRPDKSNCTVECQSKIESADWHFWQPVNGKESKIRSLLWYETIYFPIGWKVADANEENQTSQTITYRKKKKTRDQGTKTNVKKNNNRLFKKIPKKHKSRNMTGEDDGSMGYNHTTRFGSDCLVIFRNPRFNAANT
jgi:hypothetical protein